MHPFFSEIKQYPALEKSCRTDLVKLPDSYKGKGTIKAILLGADPTNDGIKTCKGLKQLDTVFGIGSEFENAFFTPQFVNLKAIGLTNKDHLFIQNLCRNYFRDQTSENKNWSQVAKIWFPFLAEELSAINNAIPVLVTAEKIMKVLVPGLPSAEKIYNMKHKLPFFSPDLNRKVFPLYRQPTYYLSNNWPGYREYLKQAINE